MVVNSGFDVVDEWTSGFHPGDLIIVAGCPSMGKTAFSLGIVRHVGIVENVHVALFSLGISKEHLISRMLCSEARVDIHRFQSGFLAKADWPNLMTAASKLSEAPILIDDSPELSVLGMKAKARQLKAEKGLGLVIVDYLQLISGRGTTDKPEQDIFEITRSLKSLAKEFHVPVIALYQLNQAIESRQDKRPQLTDLGESGSIADVVIFIYREEVYERDVEAVKGIADIIISKQRNGPVGTVKLAFNDTFMDFQNRDY